MQGPSTEVAIEYESVRTVFSMALAVHPKWIALAHRDVVGRRERCVSG